jgi:hypothetical protein
MFRVRIATLALAGILAVRPMTAFASTQNVDLDAQASNGSESKVDLNVLTSFPVKVENIVTNKAVGYSFDFSWLSAGPGGFTSSCAPGTAGGVGAKWTWTTNQTIFSFTGTTCPKDICFLKTAGSSSVTSACTLGCLDDGVVLSVGKSATPGEAVLSWTGGTANFSVYRSTSAATVTDSANLRTTTSLRTYTDVPPGGIVFYQVRGATCVTAKPCTTSADCLAGEGTCVSRGPFAVPGRSLTAGDITVSSASLTSSLVTFFSPPHEVFRVTSTANPGASEETFTNTSTAPVTIVTEAYPPGCCPADPAVPHQLRCGDECVDFLNDPLNCGACGNVCGDGTCCSNGSCESLCADGQVWCDGACVDLRNDSANCGACGSTCGDDSCCFEGACASLCADGQVWCDGRCADVEDDSANCGACGATCGDGTCCFEGGCASECAPGRTWCDGECLDSLNDPQNCGACGNVCGEGSCCLGGTCSPQLCEDGRTLCGDLCYDTQNDPSNCGACGNVCDSDSICTGGACVRCTGHGGAKDSCDNRCTNLNTDPYNCGACGVSCNVGCPSGFKGVCSNGESCRCVAGDPAPPPPSNIPDPSSPFCPDTPPADPVPAVCPNPNPSPGPVDGVCPNPSPTHPVAGVCPSTGEPPPPVAEAPVCTVDPGTETVPPGETSVVCRPGGVLFKEVPSIVSVCGDTIPGPQGTCLDGVSNVSTGTFMRLVPDTETQVGDAYVTPYAVHVLSDSSGDGLIGPGETATLGIDVLNAGPAVISNASATLLAPLADLTDDDVDNPVDVTVVQGFSSYGNVEGTAPAADCQSPVLHTASNAVAFQVTLPSDHPGDVSRPFTLQFHGTVNGQPYSMDVPLAIGVADACVYTAGTRDFDGLDGLLSPMTKLVPVGEPVPFPDHTFNRGLTRPLKLRQLCGGVALLGPDVDPPEIVGLSEASRGPFDITSITINDDTGTSDPFFRWTDTAQQWIYNLRTSQIGTGTFTLTIRIAGRKDYVTGFVLR